MFSFKFTLLGKSMMEKAEEVQAKVTWSWATLEIEEKGYLVTNDCTFCWAGNIYPRFVTIIVRYLDKLMNQTWTVMSGNTVMNRRGICVVCTYILVCVYVCPDTLSCICVWMYIYTFTYMKFSILRKEMLLRIYCM